MKRDTSKLLGDKQSLYEQESGYIVYKLSDKSDCEISFVEIDNAQKCQGEGTTLMSDFMADMRQKGVGYFNLDATVVDEAVLNLDELVKFYGKFGFLEVDRYSIDGRTIATMECDF